MGDGTIQDMGFRDLQNYTTLKPHQVQAYSLVCFRDLQNYTTLKRQVLQWM